MRFAAAFLHAYVTSRFGVEMAPELLVLSAAAYYLCDLAGSASVLLHDATASGSPQDDWETLLRWLIAANWDSGLDFATSMYNARSNGSSVSSVRLLCQWDSAGRGTGSLYTTPEDSLLCRICEGAALRRCSCSRHQKAAAECSSACAAHL